MFICMVIYISFAYQYGRSHPLGSPAPTTRPPGCDWRKWDLIFPAQPSPIPVHWILGWEPESLKGPQNERPSELAK